MYKKILVPLDGSELSEAILPHVSQLAACCGAEVVLLRVAPAPVAAASYAGLNPLLPYTPLHHLLLNQTDPVLAREPVPPILVMTSSNFSEEPIAISNKEALEKLSPLADAFCFIIVISIFAAMIQL